MAKLLTGWGEGCRQREALNEHCIEKERKITNQGQDVLYIGGYHLVLREYNVSAIGCHMYCGEFASVISLFWICKHQLGIKVMAQRTVFKNN